MFGKKEPLGKHSAASIQQTNAEKQPEQSAPESSPQKTQAQQPYSAFPPATASPQPGYVGVNAATASEEKPPRPKMSKKTKRIVFGSIGGAVLAIYIIGVIVFSNVFLPNSKLGTTDISFRTVPDVARLAEDIGRNYSVKVTGDGLDFTISSSAAGVVVSGEDVAKAAMAKNNAWLWPVMIFQNNDRTESMATQFDKAGLGELIAKQVNKVNETATDPVNASIGFSPEANAFVVTPESVGTKLDLAAVTKRIEDAIVMMEKTVTLGKDQLVQPTVFRDNPALAKARDTANSYLTVNFELVLGPNSIHVSNVGPAEVATWITVDPELNVAYSEDAMVEWVYAIANAVDTKGTDRTFVGADGNTHTIGAGKSGGDAYGWSVDSDALLENVKEGIQTNFKGQMSIPTISDAYTWTAPGSPDWGAHAEVSISQQHAWYFDAAGNLLWDADVVTGAPTAKRATPTGVWRVYKHETNYTLTGDVLPSTGEPEYRTRVAFWMPFTYTGCGFHDATWQPGFGGERYKNGYGSHGCVNLSYSSAQSLFDLISIGDAVLVYD